MYIVGRYDSFSMDRFLAFAGQEQGDFKVVYKELSLPSENLPEETWMRLRSLIAAVNLDQLQSTGSHLLMMGNIQRVDPSTLGLNGRRFWAIFLAATRFLAVLSFYCLWVGGCLFAVHSMTSHAKAKNDISVAAQVAIALCVMTSGVASIAHVFGTIPEQLQPLHNAINGQLLTVPIQKLPRAPVTPNLVNTRDAAHHLLDPTTERPLTVGNRVLVLGRQAFLLRSMIVSMLMRPSRGGIPHPIENEDLNDVEENLLCTIFAIPNRDGFKRIWQTDLTWLDLCQVLDAIYREHVPEAEWSYNYRSIEGNTNADFNAHRLAALARQNHVSIQSITDRMVKLKEQIFYKRRFDSFMSYLTRYLPNLREALGLRIPVVEANLQLEEQLRAANPGQNLSLNLGRSGV